ncbi:hypothetical protein [Chamaesiphon sp.]|uniref:hypothetical protein n=1 Tax=Chamaesiphon sp. TaxID=2814140 RepID=UPI0035934B23
MSKNTKLLCLLLKAQKIEKSSEQGYAMVVVSIVSIIMFSLLAASLIFSNLAKSRTDAFVDSQSSFSVAESGLNKRAVEFRKVLETYSGVDGVIDSTGEKGLVGCFGVGFPTVTSSASNRTSTNDFECQNYRFKSSNNIARVIAGGNIALSSGGQEQNTYVAYTLVSDRTNYVNGAAQYISIPTGDSYAGLNAAEYRYVVHSTAKKPVTLPTNLALPTYTADQKAAINRQQQGKYPETGDAALITAYNTTKAAAAAAGATAEAAGNSSNNTSLSMTFTNRVIPLFQFGIFYSGDMELNSTSPMQINGWVHSNGNMYVQPAGVSPNQANSLTTFLGRVSAAGNIYNRVDAYGTRTGITRVLLTGNDCTTGTCQTFPAYDTAQEGYLNTKTLVSAPFDTTATTQTAADRNIAAKVQDGAAGAIELRTPIPGFTRKRNYATDKVGIYYAQADMRLEMVPDRDVFDKTITPWRRNQAIIPFNFTAIRTGSPSTCTTTLPTTANTDPAANYVDPTREKLSTLGCYQFTKGQLQSLRQPVMVLTEINQTNSTSTQTVTQVRAREDLTLGKPTAPILPVLSAGANTVLTRTKILRALQVALVSTPVPVPFDRLNTAFNEPLYLPVYNPANGNGYLSVFRSGFNDLLTLIPLTELPLDDRNTLLRASPNQIAALLGAWFLPAPIQRVERPTPDIIATESARNLRSSGFYDGRERRWITMLQTNIASLSVWNRDGLYVASTDEATDLNMISVYTANNSTRGIAFNAGTGANFTRGNAFDLPTTGDATKLFGSLQYLGLGSNDKTEGGLVLHATVRDDLDGSGGSLSATNDITVSQIAANEVRKINPATGPVGPVLDYLRTYPADPTNPTNAKRKSPFAFAFNGGDYLPSALLLSSDQSIYIQGNFNNNNNNGVAQLANAATAAAGNRLPAAVVADTITVLSNECVNTITPAPLTNTSNLLGVFLGQLKCGLPPNIDGTPVTYDLVATPMAINAAFLSNTQVSNGNKGRPILPAQYSGGVNNYIRLLEDWDNNGTPLALNYTGSLISLGAPLEYSGIYVPGGGNPTSFPYYNVPFRNFNYDTNFSNVELLPPITPKASYVQQKNFTRGY